MSVIDAHLMRVFNQIIIKIKITYCKFSGRLFSQKCHHQITWQYIFQPRIVSPNVPLLHKAQQSTLSELCALKGSGFLNVA